ncbi:hypothetical protein GCM10017673_26860 [Streptosporangium violaceochromogenes]|nr:hypothetical protein GCM10017673_26860 [Streptosporangium violaceochromogenes]
MDRGGGRDAARVTTGTGDGEGDRNRRNGAVPTPAPAGRSLSRRVPAVAAGRAVAPPANRRGDP